MLPPGTYASDEKLKPGSGYGEPKAFILNQAEMMLLFDVLNAVLNDTVLREDPNHRFSRLTWLRNQLHHQID